MNNYTPQSRAAALLAKIRGDKENVLAAQEYWDAYIGEPLPPERQFLIWITRYGVDVATASIVELASWLNRASQELAKIEEEGREPTPDEEAEHTKSMLRKTKYVSGIMKNKKKAVEDGSESGDWKV